MRAVVQRVSDARVTVDGETVGSVEKGLLIYIGVGLDDDQADVDYLADKAANLRIFQDDEGKMNFSVLDVSGAALVVSQFTLFADARKGRRPSYSDAAPPERADALYQRFAAALRTIGVPTETGKFQATMKVSYTNDGPITILLDSKKMF